VGFRLSNAADEDVIHLFLDGAGLFGESQAKVYHGALNRCFHLISDNPKIARERKELSHAVRVYPFVSHVIIYKIEDSGDVLIIRVRHAREDWNDEPIAFS
jgi:toxin ParE1/3/4